MTVKKYSHIKKPLSERQGLKGEERNKRGWEKFFI